MMQILLIGLLYNPYTNKEAIYLANQKELLNVFKKIHI